MGKSTNYPTKDTNTGKEAKQKQQDNQK